MFVEQPGITGSVEYMKLNHSTISSSFFDMLSYLDMDDNSNPNRLYGILTLLIALIDLFYVCLIQNCQDLSVYRFTFGNRSQMPKHRVFNESLLMNHGGVCRAAPGFIQVC